MDRSTIQRVLGTILAFLPGSVLAAETEPSSLDLMTVALLVTATSAVFIIAWVFTLKAAIKRTKAEMRRAEDQTRQRLHTAQEEVAESEALFRSLFESSAAGMALLDMSGRYFQVNQRFCNILGYSESEMLDLTWRDVTHPDDIARVEELDRAVESGESQDFFTERRMIQKDGTVIWTSLSSAQLRDESGIPSLIFSFVQDITRLKEAEAQVLENERNLRNLFDSGPVGVGVIDRYTNDRLFINRHLLEMMGAEREAELTGVSLRETYVRQEDYDQFYAAMRSKDLFHSLEIERRRLDGSTFWCLQSFQPIGRFQGHESCVVWLVDVTEMKQAEADLAAQKVITDAALGNMDQAISMFDNEMNLALSNQRFYEMFDLPEDMCRPGTSLETMFRFVATRGDYGPGDIETQVEERLALAAKFEAHSFRRVLADGRTLEVKGNPIPSGGGFVTTYTDITEIVEAQRDSKLLQEALDTFPDMLILYDKEERVVFTNDRYHEIYPNAPSKEEITGKTMESLLRRSLDAGLIKAPLAQTDPEEWLRQSLASRRNKDGGSGETNHSNGRTYFFRYGWTTEGGMILMQTDISERKQMEEAIKESQATLRTTIDNISGGIVMCDPDRRIRLFNAEFGQLMNYPEGFIQDGMPVTDLWRFQAERGDFGDVDVEAQVARMLEIFSADDVVQYERKLSHGIYLEMRYTPLTDGGGVWIASDVTSRVEAVNALKKSEKQLQKILEDSPIAVAISLDDQSEEDGTILFTNPRFEEMLGFHSDDVGKSRTTEFFGDLEDKDAHEDTLDAGESLVNMETEVTARGGEKHWTLMSISPLDYDGHKSALIWLYDISDQKQAQAEIARKEAQLRMALDNMPGAMFVVDEALNIVLANNAYTHFYGDPEGHVRPGGSMEAVLRSEIQRGMLVGEGDPEEVLRERLASFHVQGLSIFEDKTPDGRYIQLTRKPAPDGHTVSVAVDITERKRAEQIISDTMAFINESIQYASKIQRSVLPTKAEMKAAFGDYCVVWEPRDVVGGDVYLLRRVRAGWLLLVADCTGHGVPGAFMTMIVAGALDQALAEDPGRSPGAILHRMNQMVKATLGQDTVGDFDASDDGFECCLCLLSPTERELTFAGGRMELWHDGAEELTVLKGERVGLGYRRTDADQSFGEQTIQMADGQGFFILSDGIPDQIGGDRSRAFGKKRAKAALSSEAGSPMGRVAETFLTEFHRYRGDEAQRDDVTMIGFRL